MRPDTPDLRLPFDLRQLARQTASRRRALGRLTGATTRGRGGCDGVAARLATVSGSEADGYHAALDLGQPL